MDIIPHKTCSRCNETKPLEQFHRDSGKKDGRSYWCKVCQSAYDRSPEKMEKNRAHLNRKYAENPEFREERKAYIRQYYSENEEYKQDTKDRVAKWQQENKDRVNENARQRYESHYAPVDRERKAKRRSFIAASPEHFTRQEWVELCERYNHCCLCCGQALPLTVDHVIPLSAGGSDSIDNIQPLCGPCNTRKSTRSIDYRPRWGS